MSRGMRILAAIAAPTAFAVVAALLGQPLAALVGGLAGAAIAGLAAVIASAGTASDTALVLRRSALALLCRFGLVLPTVVIAARLRPDAALAIAVIVAGGVACAAILDAFLLVPTREPARA